MSDVIRTSHFKSQFKKVKKDPRWRPIFQQPLRIMPSENRSPWQSILDCFFDDTPIPAYFYSHSITLSTEQRQIIKHRLNLQLSHDIEIKGLDLHFDGHNGDHLLIYARRMLYF